MFGRHPDSNYPAPKPPSSSEVARITGGGLVHLIVSSLNPMTYSLFLNERPVPQADVESFLIAIEAPQEGSPFGGTARAMLSRYVQTVTGERSVQQQELFPCTVEIVALGRRINVTCVNRDSLEGLWINLGLKPDGSSGEVTGARALRILLTEELLDARLTWNDGETEDLLPES